MYIKKNDQQKIKTIFYTSTQIIKEYWFNISSTLKDIFSYFEKHIKEEGFSLKSDYKIFGKKIDDQITISDLIKKDKDDIVLDGEIWIEVREEFFFDDENDEIFSKILTPKINPFELIEYDPLKQKIQFINLSQEIINLCHLYKFSKESAFCNSYTSLYLSGGEVSDKAINTFWIINKNDYKIIKKSMPIYKKYHSMLFIPDNFIFIAGGNSLSTIIYDIENQEYIKWANMNKKHFQPGLLIYGDYVYAFSSLIDKKNNNNNFFEKTNLTSKKLKWEIIYPKYDNKINFDCHFFGVSKYLEGNILLVGGEKNTQNYLYNTNTNMLSISNGKYSNTPFWDKTFYKVNKYYNVSIPLNFSKNYQIAFIDKETESLLIADCDINTGSIKFNLEKDNKKQGNIYMQSTIKNTKNEEKTNIQTGKSPKNIMQKINEFNKNYKPKQSVNINSNIFTNNEDLDFFPETIIIDVCYDNKEKIDENLNYLKTNKKYGKRKSFLYIPESAVEENIMNREIYIHLKREKNNFEKKIRKRHSPINKNENNGKEKNEENKENKSFADLNGIYYYKNKNNSPFIKKKLANKNQSPFLSNSAINGQIRNNYLDLKDFKDNKIKISGNKIKNKNKNKSINKKNEIECEIPELKIEKEEEEEEEEEEEDEEEEDEGEREETIIINYGDNFENDDFNYKIKKNRINKFLYIPTFFIDNQVINRKVEIKENQIDNEKRMINRENSKPYIKKRIESNNRPPISKSTDRRIKKNYKTIETEMANNIKTENEPKTVKKYKRIRQIFIPEYTIENQIVKRELVPYLKQTI